MAGQSNVINLFGRLLLASITSVWARRFDGHETGRARDGDAISRRGQGSGFTIYTERDDGVGVAVCHVEEFSTGRDCETPWLLTTGRLSGNESETGWSHGEDSDTVVATIGPVHILT